MCEWMVRIDLKAAWNLLVSDAKNSHIGSSKHSRPLNSTTEKKTKLKRKENILKQISNFIDFEKCCFRMIRIKRLSLIKKFIDSFRFGRTKKTI